MSTMEGLKRRVELREASLERKASPLDIAKKTLSTIFGSVKSIKEVRKIEVENSGEDINFNVHIVIGVVSEEGVNINTNVGVVGIFTTTEGKVKLKSYKIKAVPGLGPQVRAVLEPEIEKVRTPLQVAKKISETKTPLTILHPRERSPEKFHTVAPKEEVVEEKTPNVLSEVSVGSRILHGGVLYEVNEIPSSENGNRYILRLPGNRTSIPYDISREELIKRIDSGEVKIIPPLERNFTLPRNLGEVSLMKPKEDHTFDLPLQSNTEEDLKLNEGSKNNFLSRGNKIIKGFWSLFKRKTTTPETASLSPIRDREVKETNLKPRAVEVSAPEPIAEINDLNVAGIAKKETKKIDSVEYQAMQQDLKMLNSAIQQSQGVVNLKESDFLSEYGQEVWRKIKTNNKNTSRLHNFNKNELQTIGDEIERRLS